MKLSGVTFRNDEEDGGRNRQEILKELIMLNRQIFTADLIYTTYNGEFAVKVMENATKQVIGWIPKAELYKFINKTVSYMTGFISDYSNENGSIYGVMLVEPQPPTPDQYNKMAEFCRQNNYSMPAFDIRAYKLIMPNLTGI